MRTCACCGQDIPTSTRATVQVDDDLLRLCNEAFAEAEQRGHGLVEVAHLLMCLARSPIERGCLETLGISRLALHEACLRFLCDKVLEARSERLATADDLKALLAFAERRAQADQRDFASPADLASVLIDEALALRTVEALAVWSRGRSIRQEGEVRSASSSQQRDTRAWPRREKQLELELRRSPPAASPCAFDEAEDAALDTDHPEMDDAQDGHAHRRQRQFPQARSSSRGRSIWEDDARADGGSPEKRDLLQRLQRQEHQLSELRALVGRLLDRQAEMSAEQRRSRGGALRWARLKGGDAGDRLRFQRFGNDHRGGTAADDGRSANGKPSEPHGFERDDRSRRSARMRDAQRTAQTFSDPLTGSADNDTEDDSGGANGRMKRFYLSPDDDIVKAPSIGPRTAARLIPVGLVLVRDLLNCNAEDVAERVGARYINAARINEWKAQSRLVCTIPWLRGMHAQLLVGAGFDTLTKLVRADASAVCAAVLRFSATREGQSILRSGPPPEIDRIACWIENTALAEPARAA